MRGMFSKYSPELLKGSTYCLLLYIVKREPLYGYRIIKEIERRSNGYLKFKEGTIYPALHRLERDGLIVGKWESVHSEVDRRQERRYYYITRKGEKALEKMMSEWHGFVNAVNLVLEPSKG
ncbi:MAG: helix-turn-helix transcriptional regulator [Actinobacteria bacterium]|nr:helix-turn-helix transcriptional regulator [Actinomycetota bacterium]